jgi:hypothetical protein
LDPRQILGQGQNTEGEEEGAAWIALVNTLCAQHCEAAIRKEGPHPRIAGERVGEEPRTVLGYGVQQNLPLDRVKGIFKVQLE